MQTNSTRPLSTGGATALYVGALLGPSLLLMPGLADGQAGPASIVAWLVLLVLSGFIARLFTLLGVRIPAGGTTGYVTAGLGPRAGRIVGWCFVSGVVFGVPVVCLIGGSYVAALFGVGRPAALLAAVALLILVVAVTVGGARVGVVAQLGLVAALVAVVVVAVAGSLPHGHVAHWAPFAPHGWHAVGSAASSVMLALVGWEAISPLTGRLPNPRRQLPRVTGGAFAITSAVYLGSAVATITVLGDAPGPAPLAALLRAAIGAAGPALAAITAVVLTLATTNAYLSGAAAAVAGLRRGADPARAADRSCASTPPTGRPCDVGTPCAGTPPAAGTPATGQLAGVGTPRTGRPRAAASRGWQLQLAIAGAGVVLLGGVASGVLSLTDLVALPTALFLTVYLACTVAATRLFRGGARVAAAGCTIAVAVLLTFAGYGLLAPAAVILVTSAAAPARALQRALSA